MFTVRDAENAMVAFTIIALALMVVIFFHELLIKHNNVVSCFYAVFNNVSNILSAATLITIFEEGFDLMFFRRTREERAKLKAEKDQLETLKKEIQDLQNVPQEGRSTSKSENVKADSQPQKHLSKTDN